MNKRLISLTLCLAILLTTGCSKGTTSSAPASSAASSTTAEPVEATTAVVTTTKPNVVADVWEGSEYTNPVNQAKFDVLVSRVATDLMSRGIIIQDVTEDELNNMAQDAENTLNDVSGGLDSGITIGDGAVDTSSSTPDESSTASDGTAEAPEGTTTAVTTAAPKLTEAEKLAKKQDKLLSGAISYIKKTFAKVSHTNSDEYQEALSTMIDHFAESSISTSDLASYLANYIADKCDTGDAWVPAFSRISDVMSGTSLDCLSVASGIYKNTALPRASADWLSLYQTCANLDKTKVSVGDMPIGQGANISTFSNAYDTAKSAWGITDIEGGVSGVYFGTHQFRLPYIYKTEMREVVIDPDKGKTKEVEVDITDYYSKDFSYNQDTATLDGEFICSDIGQLTVMNLFTTITDNLDGSHANLINYMRDNMSDVYDKYEALSKKYTVKTNAPTTNTPSPEGTTAPTEGSDAASTTVADNSIPDIADTSADNSIPDIIETGTQAGGFGTTSSDGGLSIGELTVSSDTGTTDSSVEPEEELPYGDLLKSTTLTADNESKLWVDFIAYLKKDMSKKEYIGAWDELCSIIDLDSYSFLQLVNLFAVSPNTSCGTYRMDLDSGLKATIYYDGNGLSSYDWYLQIPIITDTITISELRSLLMDYVIFVGGFTGKSYSDTLDVALSGAVNRVNLGEYAIGIDYFTYAGAVLTIAKG